MRPVRNAVVVAMVILGFHAPPSTAQIEPTFAWAPTAPNIGENTTFTIGGVGASVDKATWKMGDTGCNGASASQVCTPSPFDSCTARAFRYAASGNKEVQLSIEIDGVTYTDDRPASERTVVVSSTGSCDGGGVSCSNVILEPGFEGGTGSAWSESSSYGYFLITMNRPRSGSFSAWLGGIDNEVSSVWQSPAINQEALSAKLSYWYLIESDDTCGHDDGGLKVDGLTARNHDYDLCESSNTGDYVLSDFVDLLPCAGTAPEIRFFTDTDFSGVSSLYVDDVVLEICVAGVPEDFIFSDNFEMGNTDAWSSTVP